jgi:hypothetical protein
MTITPFNFKEHAQDIRKWGEKHQFPLPPLDFLPDIGLVVNNAAAGFLYTSNSKLGWIEWVFSNPEKPAEERTEALDTLMSALEQIAITRGLKALFSSSGSTGYQKVLERNSFKQTDTNVTQYVKGIG